MLGTLARPFGNFLRIDKFRHLPVVRQDRCLRFLVSAFGLALLFLFGAPGSASAAELPVKIRFSQADQAITVLNNGECAINRMRVRATAKVGAVLQIWIGHNGFVRKISAPLKPQFYYVIPLRELKDAEGKNIPQRQFVGELTVEGNVCGANRSKTTPFNRYVG